MEQRNESTPKIASSPQTEGVTIAPAQIWGLLNPQQKQGVFQHLVRLCQELLSQPQPDEPEAPDELV
jgi:hypothetical protein